MAKNIREIKPDPIISSTVEIRFHSDLKEDEVLGVFYQAFGKKYPKITQQEIPKQLKSIKPELEFLSDYILSNDEYSIAVSNKSIAFENIGGYKLWDNYFSNIKQSLNVLSDLKIIKSISRIGLRYISLFEGKKSFRDSLNLKLLVDYNGYSQDSEFFRVSLKKNDISINLQAGQNATATKGLISKTGLYLDIDVFQSSNLPKIISKELIDNINLLHNEEKAIFEFLILDSFLIDFEVTY